MSEEHRIGTFTIDHELGADPLGVWLRARDALDRVVALRVWRLRGDLSSLRSPIRDRAQRAAAIAHPNLPTVYGREEMGVSDLLSVEFIEGDTLEQLLTTGARWRPLDAARLVIHLADAVAVAHDSGLAHGRIRPSAVRLTAAGRPVLLDLGVAKTAEDARAPLIDPPSRSADVAALAELVHALAAAGAPAADPMYAVEMSLLEPVLREASRPRSRIVPDAGALRDALMRVVSPDGAPRRTARVAAEPPGPAAFDGLPRPRGVPSGNLSVLLPVERDDRRVRPGRRIAAGLLFGAVLATGVIAYRAGALGFGGNDSTYPVQTIEPALASAPPPAPVPAASALDTAPDSLAGAPLVDPETPPVRDPLAGITGDTVPDQARPTTADARDTSPIAPAAAPPRPTRSAAVTVTPPDAVITRAATGDYLGLGRAQLGVPQGDSVMLEFSHAGYVSQRRAFRGTPFQVALVADSVDVAFQSNVPVDVVLETAQGDVPIGRTNLNARLPTGDFRVRFESGLYPEWSTAARFDQPGTSYRISKMDYPTRGALVIAVPGGWANVSVNGSPERESPARFEDLPDFPHVVRLSRAGYETIVDTVRVVPGEVTTRQYRLQPIR